MVKRKVSKNKYLIALLITLAVFSLGMLLGLFVENGRLQLVESQNLEQEVDFNSLQLQYQFIDLLGEEKNCDALEKTFEESINNLETSRKKVEAYLKDSSLNKNEFGLLKREYTLSQIRFWLLNKKTEDLCQMDHAVILYFYADDAQCAGCADQAVILTHLKNKFGISLLNFAFDGQFTDEPTIDILKSIYDIKEYPTLVINGETFSGFTAQETILKEICPTFQNAFELCEGKGIVRIS